MAPVRKLTDADIKSVNSEWKNFLRDAGTVLSNDPTFSDTGFDKVGEVIGWFDAYLHSDSFVKRGDIGVSFNGLSYYIRPDNLTKLEVK